MRNQKIFTCASLFFALLTLITSSCGKRPHQSSSSVESYTITWKNYDGAILEIDSNIKMGEIPTYDGNVPEKPSDERYSYTWSGWTPEITPALKNQTYTAIYSSNQIQYEITYNLYGGVNDPSNPTFYTFEDHISFKAATKTGYTFLGWEDNKGERITSIASGHTGPLVLHAIWNKGNEYSLTLDANGGILSQNQLTIQFDHEYSLPDPTLIGHTFDGWYVGEEKIESQGIWHIAQDITLVAKWSFEYYAIIYHLDGGLNHPDNPSTYTIETETITLKEASKNGYTFGGWYDESFDNQITSIEKGSLKEINLFAKWEIITYQINYDLDGGDNDINNPLSYTIEDEINLLEPTKNGYSFDGWFHNGTLLSTIQRGTFGNLTLKAKWSPYKNGFTVITEDMEKGSVIVVSGSGYTDETIIIKAVPAEGYVFEGWYKNGLEKISKEETYTFTMPYRDIFLSARFVTEAEYEDAILKKYGMKPVLSDDGKTLTYGLYPQKNVTDTELIDSLNQLTETATNGWYLYDEEYYAKVIANPYDKNIQFDNGDSIIKDEVYWFHCEAIQWNVLEDYMGEIRLISSSLLENHDYYTSYATRNIDNKTIYANNYEHSTLRSWLNNEFYNSAFALNSSFIQTTLVDNSKETNQLDSDTYISNNTMDNVFILSVQEFLNSDYGFHSTKDQTSTRFCKPTDYAKANGAYYYPSAGLSFQYCGSYWTRSPLEGYPYYSQVVNVNGGIVSSPIISPSSGVRPSIFIKMN